MAAPEPGQRAGSRRSSRFSPAPRRSVSAVSGKSSTDRSPAATSAAYAAGRIRSSCTPIWPATTKKLSDVACNSAAAGLPREEERQQNDGRDLGDRGARDNELSKRRTSLTRVLIADPNQGAS